MPILKEDLAFEHYTWEANSNSAYMGTPSRRLFNRYNGDQVLFIINSYCEEAGNLTAKDARLLEDFIINQLPLEAKSEISVLNWLKELQLIPEEKQ